MKAWLESLSRWPAWVVWGLAVAWSLLIVYASSQKGSDLPKIGIPHFDKIAHFGVFAVGGALVTWAFCRWPMPLRRALILGIISVSLFGAIDEWHQLYTPGRTGGDFYDWMADFTGAIIGSFFAPPVFLQGYVRTLTARSRRPGPLPLPGN